MQNVRVQVVWEPEDRHAGLSRFVAVGGLGAVALAVFGLPPFSLHGPLHRFGVMDPLCGMTRAVRFLARGDLADAWRYNPASFVLLASAIIVALRWVVGKLRGRWWNVTVPSRRVLLPIFGFAVAVLWVNQQAHVSLLK